MSKESILFSVVIPTYNHAELLKIALTSVVNQSYKNWEAIIVDNNSTDDSIEIINSFNDKRIKIISIHNNGVIAASRNLGIKESKGDWIAFLDSDDIWYQDKLRDINKNIKALKNIDVICNDEKIVFENSYKNKIQRYGPLSKNAYKHMLVYGNKLSTSATVVKRNFIVKNSIYFNQSNDFVTVEDYDFWLNLALSGANFKFLHQVHGEYFIHNSNNSKGGNNIHELNNIKLLKHHVFNVQTFDTKTHKLWKKINHRLTIHQEFSNINRNNFALKTFTISKLILKMPIFSIFYLVEKIYLRSANYLLSRFS
jgi:glycosyltransferase involved in cell wall biosynthesis